MNNVLITELKRLRKEVMAYQDAFDSQPWATDEHPRVLLNRISAELYRLREALEYIAAGKCSGYALLTNPPKDPAQEYARQAIKLSSPVIVNETVGRTNK
jgi:hypothetical protein